MLQPSLFSNLSFSFILLFSSSVLENLEKEKAKKKVVKYGNGAAKHETQLIKKVLNLNARGSGYSNIPFTMKKVHLEM